MDDQLTVDVVDALADLSHDACHLRLLHPVVLSQSLQELPARAELYQKIDVLFVVEEAVERCDVAML